VTEEIPFDRLVEALSSPTISQNSQSVMQMLQEAHTFVAEINKIAQTADKTLSMVQRYGIPVDRLVAGLCKKAGIDLYTPISDQHGQVISQPAGQVAGQIIGQVRSPIHQSLYARLNQLNEGQIIAFISDIEQLQHQKAGNNEDRSVGRPNKD